MSKNAIDKATLKAIEILKSGGVVIYPTDTIWGIGCDATNAEAVERVRSIKGREATKALIILADSIDMVQGYTAPLSSDVKHLVEDTAEPLTVIYEGAHGLAPGVASAEGTVAIRIPRFDLCRQLCSALGAPIVSTSANFSGEPSPDSWHDIPSKMKDMVDYVFAPEYEPSSPSTGASKIVKVNPDGSITRLR